MSNSDIQDESTKRIERQNNSEKSDNMDQSLDEVSNVIHDLLSDPETDETISKASLQSDDKLDTDADQIPEPDPVVKSLLEPRETEPRNRRYAFDEFIDERILVSSDAFGKKEMKIKVLEVSDEKAPTAWKLGDRVKVNKILITIKHLEGQEVEEAEFDIQSIEKELAQKRHYTSTNRWVPTSDIKNGYVAGSRHTSLISDAVALDYIVF